MTSPTQTPTGAGIKICAIKNCQYLEVKYIHQLTVVGNINLTMTID